jgi:flagellin
MLTVNTNSLSLSIQKSLFNNQKEMMQASTRLSTGKRINSAKDDAAGLAIAERMTSQIRGMEQGKRNVGDATSLAETAEGATDAITKALQRMREIAVQSTSDSNTTNDRAALDVEYQALSTEIDRIATSTTFNGKKILSTEAGAQIFQVGANTGDTITLSTTDITTLNDAFVDVTTQISADAEIARLDTALDTINTNRATYGAYQSRFEYTTDNLNSSISALTDARSRIMDADVAKESSALSRAQVLQQAGIAMLGQSNQQAGMLLNLFA